MKYLAPFIVAAVCAASAAHAQTGGAIDAARAARRAQDFAAAERAYGQALAARPGDAEILTELALVQGFQAHYDAALATILRAEAAAPNDLDIRLAKARILGWMGRYAEAGTALDQVAGGAAPRRRRACLAGTSRAVSEHAGPGARRFRPRAGVGRPQSRCGDRPGRRGPRRR